MFVLHWPESVKITFQITNFQTTFQWSQQQQDLCVATFRLLQSEQARHSYRFLQQASVRSGKCVWRTEESENPFASRKWYLCYTGRSFYRHHRHHAPVSIQCCDSKWRISSINRKVLNSLTSQTCQKCIPIKTLFWYLEIPLSALVMFNIIFIDRLVKLKCSLNTNTEKLFDTLFIFPQGIAEIEVSRVL